MPILTYVKSRLKFDTIVSLPSEFIRGILSTKSISTFPPLFPHNILTFSLCLGLDYIQFKYHNEDNGDEVQVKVWDTAGQERFKTITYNFYRQAQGVLITFDVTNTESYDNVKTWIESLEKHAKPDIIKILVANKVDLTEKRKISTIAVENLAKKYNMHFFETSAKENLNISEAINYLVEAVYDQRFIEYAGEEANSYAPSRGSQLRDIQNSKK